MAGAAGLGLLGRQDLAAAPRVAAVLESPFLFHLMEKLLQVNGSLNPQGICASLG